MPNATVTVSYPDAALGTKLPVETLWGEEELTIPAGTQPGDVIRLRGKGIANVHRGGGKGDHLVEVILEVPKKHSGKQRKALEAYAETMR